jgi:hypothetical protein
MEFFSLRLRSGTHPASDPTGTGGFYPGVKRKDMKMTTHYHLRGCIQKFPDWVDNEVNDYNNKHSLRSNTKSYDSKIHWSDSRNGGKTTPGGRELYFLQF